MRPDREMACWSCPSPPTRRTFAIVLAEAAEFAAVMGLLMVCLVLA